jgi:hypothetical protein
MFSKLTNYYKQCVNFYNFRLILFYDLKWSLLLTLAQKSKKTLNYIHKKHMFNFIKNSLKSLLMQKTKKISANYIYYYIL